MIQSKSNYIKKNGVDITIVRTPTNYTVKALIGKIGRTNQHYSVQNERLIETLLDSNLTTGEIVTYGTESYLCITARPEIARGIKVCLEAHGLLCNSTITVIRDTIVYDSNGNPQGTTPTNILNSVSCHVRVVTEGMKLKDPGYLPSTVLEVYAPNNTNVKELDKAVVAGGNYRIDSIDRFKFPGVMVLQLSVLVGG